MKKMFLFEKHAKISEDCNKFSRSVSYETLVGGTPTECSAYEQTQCLSKGSASAPLDAVGTLTSQLCCSTKVVENLLHCHPERSEGSRKSNTKDWILHFASAPFKMTIMTLSLILSLNLSTAWALTCTFTPDQNNSGKYSLSVTGTGTGNTFDASSCDGQLPTDMSSWSDRTNKITSVTFDESVTFIDYYAFSGATSLTSVDMPNVTSLAEGAFEGATSLASVDMPKIEYITDGAFAGIPSLKYVGLPSQSVTIGSYAFYNTPVQSCSTSNPSACGSCSSGEYVMPGRGCVADCGTGYSVDSSTNRCVANTPEPQEQGGQEQGEQAQDSQVSEASCYAKGQVFWDNACVDEYPFAKKHWTPAEAAQYLKDTDNEIIMTFKVNR